ncbi:hypothetical protein ACE6ED_15745 [Paenibacillus sp. CN-4]|uniref:hypothetical protein n=1 Tax=Paenibacillus nanchangensis TaxID=3348343 RepID=UPI00397A5CE3
MNNWSREKFEKIFKEVNASASFEGADLNVEEKELLFQYFFGKITNEEYAKAVMELVKK